MRDRPSSYDHLREQPVTPAQTAKGVARLIRDAEHQHSTPAQRVIAELASEAFALLSVLHQAEQRGFDCSRLARLRESWAVLADPTTGVPMLIGGDLAAQLKASVDGGGDGDGR